MSHVLFEMQQQVPKLDTLEDGSPRYTFQRVMPVKVEGETDCKIRNEDIIGEGSYGAVVRAYDRQLMKNVAVKRIGWHTITREIRRILREVQVLRHCNHPNLIRLRALYALDTEDSEEQELSDPASCMVHPYNLFIVCQLMSMPLSQLIHQQMEAAWKNSEHRPYALKHARWLAHQMFHGLHGLHSAGVVHRDIKPQNLLVNTSDTKLKIIDFGLSRASRRDAAKVSHYVVTRLYRAPELIYGSHSLDTAMDIWSAGCVAAELLICQPLFNVQSTYADGKYNGQRASVALLHILNHIGKPSPEDISRVQHTNVREFLTKITAQHLDKKSIDRDLCQHISNNLKIKTGDLQDSDMQKMIALIDTSLQFCPSQRPTAAQLMQHEVFDFNSGIAPEGCETFTDEEATEMQGYTDEKGKQLLRRLTEQPLQVEYSSDEESNSDQDSERGGEGGGMIGFLRLLISGENPSTHMWDASAECQQEHFDAACRECGIVQSHAAIQALTPEQLSMLGKNLGQRLQACALAFLNNQPIVAHNTVPITPDNVMQLRPQLYAYLNTLPEASEEQEMIVGAVRVNLEFLAEYDSILSIGGSAVAGDTDWSFAQDHVEETTGELEVDAADETWCLAGTRGQQ